MTSSQASSTLSTKEQQENTLLIFHISNSWNLLSEVLNYECKHLIYLEQKEKKWCFNLFLIAV